MFREQKRYLKHVETKVRSCANVFGQYCRRQIHRFSGPMLMKMHPIRVPVPPHGPIIGPKEAYNLQEAC